MPEHPFASGSSQYRAECPHSILKDAKMKTMLTHFPY